jgi:hypothetical protein
VTFSATISANLFNGPDERIPISDVALSLGNEFRGKLTTFGETNLLIRQPNLPAAPNEPNRRVQLIAIFVA